MTVLHFCLLPSANIVLFSEFNKSVINKFVKYGLGFGIIGRGLNKFGWLH